MVFLLLPRKRATFKMFSSFVTETTYTLTMHVAKGKEWEPDYV